MVNPIDLYNKVINTYYLRSAPTLNVMTANPFAKCKTNDYMLSDILSVTFMGLMVGHITIRPALECMRR